MLSPGDKVKDCEIIAPLGSGGMARLYLARRRGVGGFSRLVTLKLVHQHLAEDTNVIRLFLDEARISAHVAHPNVVHVEDVGQYSGSYFIAMEYVHGVSLAELLGRLNQRRLRLRPKLCVWIAAQVAEALHAAHEAKGDDGSPLSIVHHDVSPQNVLISHTGHVKLIDFGIAKSQAESDSRFGRRRVLGKLRYMAPEQLRLERADRRADVYALGVMLWEMLAGRGLFRCQRFDDERDWATREDPPPPSRYSSHSTPLLDRVVLKAIACDANERFENAFQFRTALLKADPCALQLDAPRVAALLRTTLGDELERRRASWPSEVVGELEVAPELAANVNVEELTAENPGVAALESEQAEPVSRTRAVSSGSDEDEDDDDSPTLALRITKSWKAIGHSLASLRPTPTAEAPRGPAPEPEDASETEQTITPVVVLPARRVAPREQTVIGMPMFVPASAIESEIDTLKCSPVTVRRIETAVSGRSYRAAMIGSVCLAAGVCLGSLFSSTPPAEVETKLDFASDPPAVAPPTPPPADTFMLPSPAPGASQPSAADASTPYALEDCTLSAGVDPKILIASHAGGTRADPSRTARAQRKEPRSYGSRRGAWRGGKHSAKPASKSGSSRRWSWRHARASENE